jgi:hypothetical protein
MDDGKVLVAGAFDYVRGQPRANLARLNATGQAISSLGFDGSTIRWSRGGTSPEVWRTAFEVSTNGTTWANVGAGTRMAGGWQLSGVSLPEGSTLRARGFVVGGNYNASSWFVERSIVVTTAPVILVNDPSFGVRSNQFNFQVRAVAGQTVVIEASSNLRDWVPRSTNQVTSTVFGFADPIYLPARFYRARVVN